MEPIRPQIDAYLLDWITRQPLRREWFCEQRDGNCRLAGSFGVRLSETAPIWRRAVAPIAEWVARAFWSTIRKPDAPLPTRLTQNNKREAKGARLQSATTRIPSQENICAGCGKPIRNKSTNCPDCSLKNSTASLIEGAKLGRVVGHTPLAEARRRDSKRRHDLARQNWCRSEQPSWLTEDFYAKEIQPRLNGITLSQIATTISVSIPYASDIRRGRRKPHPRHWRSLASLAGLELTNL
jgi:hypothetical protein